MNMMMRIIKGRKSLRALVLLPVFILFLYIRFGDMGASSGRQPELQTFQLQDGWGYQIVMNKKVLIYQPTIPAIDTLMSFPDEAGARRVGSLVLERINNNKDFSVTKEDIQHALGDR